MAHLQVQTQDRPIMEEPLILKIPEHTPDLHQRADLDHMVVLIIQGLPIVPGLMATQDLIAQEAMVTAEVLDQDLTGVHLVTLIEADQVVSQLVVATEVLVAECLLVAPGQEVAVVFLQVVQAQEAVVPDHLQEIPDHLVAQEEVINS